MINQVKYYIFAILLLGSFFLGMKVEGWKNDSVELASLHQVKELTDKFKKQESSISATLENKLQELKANERIIEREKLKIIDRPVYNNTCLDTDGVQLLNKQRSKQDPSTGKSTN